MITIEKLKEKNAHEDVIRVFCGLLPNGGDLETCVNNLIDNDYVDYAFWLINNFKNEFNVKPLLEELSKHSNAWVARGVARNPNTPLEIKEKIKQRLRKT